MEYKKRNNAQSRVGQQLGNYRLLRLLGQGSFADVYLGEHMHLNTRASIKVLDMRLSNDDMGDFLLEARTIARLRHPNIVQILEFGVEGNTPYLVMDYAPNGTVRQRYPKDSILPLEIILPLLKQMTAALQHAHDEKIIHRDVKPENMLLGYNYELLLSDFGIAVVAHSSRTQSMRGVAGTVAYMAPEQLQGRPVFASDQYSLGVIVYEWLSGTRPFEGSFIDLVTQHTRAVPPPLHEKNPSISPALEKVVHRALAKDPQQRFASVQEFAAAVEAQWMAPAPGTELFSTSTAPLPSLTSSAKISVLPLQETTMTIYRGHTAAVNAVAWAPNDVGEVRPHRSRIASASDDGTVQIWEATTGRKQATFRGHSGAVRAIAWSPDGKRIASASVDSTVQVWEAATMHRICSYNGHSGEVTAVAWSPDGKHIASASGDNTVQVWDASSGHRILVYRGHSQSVLTVAWCSNGQHIASAGDDMTVQVWQAATGNPVLTFRNHTHEILAVAWQPHERNDQDSPGGQYIASSGADQVVHIWEALSGNILFTYRGHQFTVSALAWQPPASDATTFPENTSPQHSLRIASASFDRTVHIWDATTGNNAVSYAGHANWVYAVAWAPSGQYIASASGDKTVQVWLAV
ncbi:MAG TPA: serine/threonine-protein kinase [Ktedonobacteraceae bacterium]|nr:serine/threonine-protein kinase [Ktedonobacteraceae bacterium]